MNPETPTPQPAMQPEEFDELDTILDDLRTRSDETPQWEFCEGFMAALITCRRSIPSSEYLPVLLDTGETDGAGAFASATQFSRFMELWTRRWNEVTEALDADVKALDDERAYHPEVMDVRGAVAALPEEQRAQMADKDLPSFAQVWAVGFMYAVENWSDDWTPPRDKEAQKWLDASLQSIVALTEDDTEPPTVAVFDTDGAPSVSASRLDAFAEALWAVYDLRELWRSIGPRVETVRREAQPGRNDACSCGSGKKFKKCCGA
jgi:uncharacterized protein